MELSFKHQIGLVCIILLFPALCYCQEYTKSRATFYSTSDGYGTPTGACGFGEYGRKMNWYDGSVAGVSGLWRNGVGCGTCYQVKCLIEKLCDENGAYLVATDQGYGDNTDFVMSPRAFTELGRDENAYEELKKYGTVDIEYRRVPCTYTGNVVFYIKETSSNPGYFAVVLLNVNGINDVTAVEMWQSGEWKALNRNYGAVFDFANPPSGEIRLRFKVSGLSDWVDPKIVIPSYWQPGSTYVTEVQLK
ncbi:expansin-like B1 [Vigna radiata var. radiata]|uniref:Expansin-like B1 n=1 Tax=Vigna radiata var. radiata TaxID=3916 RepID=A0A1S3UNL3_VIGRR|nr:expansin-like B1 [Vigna radiata var. radiata]